MKNIIDELERVIKLIRNINGKIYNREYKDDLEWWVLGKVIKILQERAKEQPVYAKKADPPNADFITFDKQKNNFKSVEITEIMPPERKRTLEYTTENFRNRNNPNVGLWLQLKDRLKNKLLKDYGKGCWLFIYFNIKYGDITPYGYWERGLKYHFDTWINANQLSFKNCKYEKILILDSKGEGLVSLFPFFEVIAREDLGGLRITQK